jgi:type I restriction enzyme R subunit
MVATGTDIKPIEIVMFMRSVKSRVLFEQMKGRGVRIINENDLKAVTPDAVTKTHFVIVDCVAVTETEMMDTQPLERKKSVSFKGLLEHVTFNGTDPEMLSSLASRLARLDKQCSPKDRQKISEIGEGAALTDISHAIIKALDPDEQIRQAKIDNQLSPDSEPTTEQLQQAQRKLLLNATKPLADMPDLRKHLVEVKKSFEQIIDEVSRDELLESGFSAEAKEKARSLVVDFETYLAENKDEIEALQFFYSQNYQERLHYKDIKAIHEAISLPPRSWTPERLWAAYQSIEANKVKGASANRRLTDIVSLIRFALKQEEELIPYASIVDERFTNWLAQQQNQGRTFTDSQQKWLKMISNHVAESLEIDLEDFSYTPFIEEGGLGKATEVFEDVGLKPLLEELNEVLVA